MEYTFLNNDLYFRICMFKMVCVYFVGLCAQACAFACVHLHACECFCANEILNVNVLHGLRKEPRGLKMNSILSQSLLFITYAGLATCLS